MNYYQTTGAYKSKRKSHLVREIVSAIIGLIFGILVMLLIEIPVRAEEISDMPGAVYVNGGVEDDLTWNPYASIEISDEEFKELRWVVALEAQGEGFYGECAVVEAIFNRVLSDVHDWGGNVHGVLSKKGQFSTYKRIGSSKAWAKPGELEDDAISEVIRKGPSILPSMRYVYFDSKGGVNGKDRIKIGGHTFGRE